jgi:hypothetical protein
VADLQSKVKRLKINGTLLISEGVLCVWILIRVCISHKSSFVVFCCMMRARARSRERASAAQQNCRELSYKDVLMAAKILRRHVSAADKKAERRFMYHYND